MVLESLSNFRECILQRLKEKKPGSQATMDAMWYAMLSLRQARIIAVGSEHQGDEQFSTFSQLPIWYFHDGGVLLVLISLERALQRVTWTTELK